QRQGQAAEDERQRGGAIAERGAEVAVERAAEELQVLHRGRLVEAHLVAELGDLRGWGVERQQHGGGVAGEPGQAEDDDRDAEENEDAVQQALQDVDEHGDVRGLPYPLVTSVMW